MRAWLVSSLTPSPPLASLGEAIRSLDLTYLRDAMRTVDSVRLRRIQSICLQLHFAFPPGNLQLCQLCSLTVIAHPVTTPLRVWEVLYIRKAPAVWVTGQRPP